MIDVQIYSEFGDILGLMQKQRFEEALNLISSKFNNELEFEKLMHLFLLQSYCYYSSEEYPLAINVLGKILKYKYNSGIEHHLLSQSYYLLALSHIEHSHGTNKAKNRSTFNAISSCINLLCYRQETIDLMDRFINMLGEGRVEKK